MYNLKSFYGGFFSKVFRLQENSIYIYFVWGNKIVLFLLFNFTVSSIIYLNLRSSLISLSLFLCLQGSLNCNLCLCCLKFYLLNSSKTCCFLVLFYGFSVFLIIILVCPINSFVLRAAFIKHYKLYFLPNNICLMN